MEYVAASVSDIVLNISFRSYSLFIRHSQKAIFRFQYSTLLSLSLSFFLFAGNLLGFISVEN